MRLKFIIKTGNKLDLYGKVDGLRYFSDNAGDDGDPVLRPYWL